MRPQGVAKECGSYGNDIKHRETVHQSKHPQSEEQLCLLANTTLSGSPGSISKSGKNTIGGGTMLNQDFKEFIQQ